MIYSEIKRFDVEDQMSFARLSGDFNKIHIDDIAARRYIYGQIVVHGLHLVVLSLENWLNSDPKKIKLEWLQVQFKRPVFIGQQNIFSRVREDGCNVKIELFDDKGVVTDIRFQYFIDTTSYEATVANKSPVIPCQKRRASDLITLKGELEICWDLVSAAKLFPLLVSSMPHLQLAQLLTLTRLVGMECPGENSLFSDINIRFNENGSGNSLTYKVVEFDDRFSKVTIDIMGPTIQGVIGAFLRPEPKQQLSYLEIKTFVSPDEFLGQTSMIIGGSRGLGEVTAKLLAAGGAKVILTYNKGHDDALKIKNEITNDGGLAEIFHWNVLENNQENAKNESILSVTHLYYFATPVIIPGQKQFSRELFDKYCKYYVLGLSNAVDTLLSGSNARQYVFYPSTIFIDECPKNFAEYVIAKTAGEKFCDYLRFNKKNLHVLSPRLPKLSTDQTQEIYNKESVLDPTPIVLGYLRMMK